MMPPTADGRHGVGDRDVASLELELMTQAGALFAGDPLTLDTRIAAVNQVIRLAAQLGAHRACLVRRHNGPPWQARRNQLDVRDRAIREAIQLYPGPRKTAARALVADFGEYLAGGWLREKDLPLLVASPSEKRRLFYEIAILNNGRALGLRQVLYIADGARGGAKINL
jgi:hypothetical protein